MTKTKKLPADSPALTLIRHVNQHQGRGLGRSNFRFDCCMRDALRLCIRYGVEFATEDLIWLAGKPEGWADQRAVAGKSRYDVILSPTEFDYAIACGSERGHGSITFAWAYEHWRKRKPFLIAQPRVTMRQRVYVGLSFILPGDGQFTCTSFADDGESFIATKTERIYESEDDKYGRDKVKCRKRITRKLLAEINDAFAAASSSHSSNSSHQEQQP